MNLQENLKNNLVLQFLKKPKLKNSKMVLGFSFAILAAALTALTDVIPKPMMESNPSGITPNPIMIVFVIYVVNGLFFTPLSRNQSPLKKIGRKAIFLLILLGLAEASGTVAFTMGLAETSGVNASILKNGETIFAVLIGIVIFKEKLGKNEILPFFLILLGAIAIPMCSDLQNHGLQFTEFVMGDLLILLGGFFYCLDTFIAKHVADSIKTRRIVHMMSCSGAGLTLFLMLLFEIPFEITFEQFSIISIIGVLGIGVTMMFFVSALKLIGAVRTVLIYSSVTIFGIIYSGIYLAEEITIFNIVSLGVVMFGLFALRHRMGEE